MNNRDPSNITPRYVHDCAYASFSLPIRNPSSDVTHAQVLLNTFTLVFSRLANKSLPEETIRKYVNSLCEESDIVHCGKP